MTNISTETLSEVAHEMHEHGLIKFGQFKLKSGIMSPFYIDLREVQSYPSTLKAVTKAFCELLVNTDKASVKLAGIPEAGVPLATAVGYELGMSLVQPRKVVKDHGTKSAVEGAFEAGDHVILIDDLITKGDSKIEAIDQVAMAELVVDKFLVLIDREQGGLELLRQEKNCEVVPAFTITELVNELRAQDSISEDQYQLIIDFIRNN
ncbi:MAG TPA: orotate phosphoribosyltransferase [Candidatus Saccharimonadales bacterium]